jgi:hypothetical protein
MTDLKPGVELIIRTAAPADIPFYYQNAKDLGWCPGDHDVENFMTLDPDGFMVGELDGKVIGCISAFKYGNEPYGFIGK